MKNAFRLEITFNVETKDCKVTGPLDNEELCALGLELARGVIKQHNTRKIIIGPSVPVPGPVRVQLPDFRMFLSNGGGQ